MTCGRKSVVADPLDDAVERLRLHHLAERELDPEGLQIILERDQLLAARRLVDAVHDRRLLRLQRLGRGDVGGDHIILDQLVRVEPLARRDREDPPLLVEHHPPLGQVELQRPALRPRRVERPPAGPERLQRRLDQRRRYGRRTGSISGIEQGEEATSTRAAPRRVDRRLRVLIGDIGRDPDPRAA